MKCIKDNHANFKSNRYQDEAPEASNESPQTPVRNHITIKDHGAVSIKGDVHNGKNYAPRMQFNDRAQSRIPVMK